MTRGSNGQNDPWVNNNECYINLRLYHSYSVKSC